MGTLRDLYHSIPLPERIPTHSVPTLSDHWLKGYPFFCTIALWTSAFKMLTTGCLRHADASKPIPFDSPRLANSNESLPNSSRYLPSEVPPFFFLLTSIALWTLRNLHHSIPLNRRIPTHPVPTLSDHWLNHYPYFCTFVPRAYSFKLLATSECYSHAATSKPIRFNSPRRADSNKALPDSGGHLPTEVAALFSLLTSIAMWTLRFLYHSSSIPIAEQNPTHSVPNLSDPWLKGYPYFCTLVLRARAFKLLATDCNRHADTSQPIPFSSRHRADSNALCPDAV